MRNIKPLLWGGRPFYTQYKENKSRVRSERRSGIGLAIVKNILQLHNMEFGVINTETGVKFWFKV